MIDPIAAFVALLLGDSTFRNSVEGRIYGAPDGLPPDAMDADKGLPKACLVVTQGGGPMVRYLPIMQPVLYLRAYASKGTRAAQVLMDLYKVLYHVSGAFAGQPKTNILINNRWFMYSSELLSLPAPVIEQQSHWPVAYGTVQARFDSLRGA